MAGRFEGKVLLLGSPYTKVSFDRVEEHLRSVGVACLRYTDGKAFLDDLPSHRDTDIVVSSAPRTRITREMMTAAPRLRGLISAISGIDGFDVAAATELGIVVANGQTIENTLGMAESTVMLMLAAIYDLHESEALLRTNAAKPPWPSARQLRGRVVGLIGFGRIAEEVALRLLPFGVEILAFTRRTIDLPAHVRRVGLDELLSASDIVSLHAALTAETRNMLDRERLALLRPDVIFVNTARGAFVDEAALHHAALERPNGRFALDTFAVEPLPPESPLRSLNNVILTPHMVGHTQEMVMASSAAAIENLDFVMKGELPPRLKNPDVGPKWVSRFGSSASA